MARGVGALARSGLVVLGLVAMGCQTPAMRQLQAQGALPNDLPERIAKLGRGMQGPAAGAAAEQEQSVPVFVRSQMPDSPSSAPLVFPPLPGPQIKKTPAPVAPVAPMAPNPVVQTSRTANPASLGSPKVVELGRLHNGGVVVAIINGEVILEEEVRMAIAQSGGEGGDTAAQRRKQAIATLVDRELVVQDVLSRLSKNPQAQKFLDKLKELAGKEFERYLRQIREKNKVASDEEFDQMLQAQGIPLDLMRRQSERNFIAMNYMQQRVMPMVDRLGGNDLRGYYDTHPEDFTVPDSVVWRHIFISPVRFNNREEARKMAESLHARVRSGEDFTRLSKEFCHGDSALRDGEGLGRKKGEIKPPELEPMIFKAAAGELLPLVELRNGFHIVRIDTREFAGVKPFDEKVQKQIRSKMREIIAQFEMKRLVAELKRVAVIEYPGQE